MPFVFASAVLVAVLDRCFGDGGGGGGRFPIYANKLQRRNTSARLLLLLLLVLLVLLVRASMLLSTRFAVAGRETVVGCSRAGWRVMYILILKLMGFSLNANKKFRNGVTTPPPPLPVLQNVRN